MTKEDPITVKVCDSKTGDVLDERTIQDDYAIICHGSVYLASKQQYPNTGTTILTIKSWKGA